MEKKPQPTRLGLAFTEDDIKRMKRIQNKLRLTHGDIKRNMLIRIALIKLEKEGI